ncbi:ribonuclease P protein component [Carboxylicivirga sp. M1479]|uniref:ribonuclease P protein component n=1 Tax=Carboxylicivirga sp. M1479 TaxID=2594476 RepID=UPI001177C6AC|nr:ribonuclease P protein component [Carboxylicivirga sp. M1479]TRX72433.1 ribonuclease P protein component [Carboxylicivirga sp. M1479]
MEQQRFTFKKQERLCSRDTIQSLFDKGQSFVKYPFRVTYMELDKNEKADAQILVSVSKRRFKRAYKRNRLKRLIREAYRLNKHQLTDELKERNVKLAIAFIYLPTEILDYTSIEKAMQKALKRVGKEALSDG